MKDRLKQVREAINIDGKKISQATLASDLGVSASNIQSYELGRRVPSNAFISLFCTKYNVNENWLRTGEGDMFKPVEKEAEIAEIAVRMLKDDDEFRKELLNIVVNLGDEELDLLKKIVLKLADTQKDRP